MSKKTKKKRRQKSFPWALVALGGLFIIKVTNTGDGTVRFKEQPYIEVLEGCCPPQLSIGKMAIKPGESTYVQSLDFMMHEGMDGKHDFGIHLRTNDPENPDFLVHALSDWGP